VCPESWSSGGGGFCADRTAAYPSVENRIQEVAVPNTSSIVTTIRRIEEQLTVELEDGLLLSLDPESPFSEGYMQVLEGTIEPELPVYLEFDPDTALITVIRLPHITRIVDLRDGQEGLDVEIDFSHARHVLRRDRFDFVGLEQRLREALSSREVVALTETDAHEIIDVRAYAPQSDLRRELRRGWWQRLTERLRRWPCVSPVRAQELFDAVAFQTCNPLTIPPPCIPYLYPDDGCWARAHSMCRTMLALGASPRKLWIQAVSPGWLRVGTRNNPRCYVEWPWHVAPTLCVTSGDGRQEMVIDPSIFTTPVTVAEWIAAQNHPRTRLTGTDWTIYYLWTNTTDPDYTQTARELTYYRLQLQLRSVGPAGPPPYAYCPA
jgi:Glutaminase